MVKKTLMTSNGSKIQTNRGFKTTPDYNIINKFRVSINTPDITYEDTDLSTLIPITGTESVDDCSVITGWSAVGTGNSVSGNSSVYKPDSGTDGSLSLIKGNTGSAELKISKTTTSRNGTSKNFIGWLYIKDSTVLTKISTVSFLYGSDSSNFMKKDYAQANLDSGWNYVTSSITGGFTSISGSPTISALDYTSVIVTTTTGTDVLTYGDLLIDSLRLASNDDYYKEIDSISIDETEGSATVISKLSITEANGFLIDGHATYNDDSTELIHTKTKFSENSKGITDLFKISTKYKFRNINQ